MSVHLFVDDSIMLILKDVILPSVGGKLDGQCFISTDRIYFKYFCLKFIKLDNSNFSN